MKRVLTTPVAVDVKEAEKKVEVESEFFPYSLKFRRRRRFPLPSLSLSPSLRRGRTDIDRRPLVVLVVLRPQHRGVAAEAQLQAGVARPDHGRRAGRGAGLRRQLRHEEAVEDAAGRRQVHDAVGDGDVSEAGLVFLCVFGVGVGGGRRQSSSSVAASFRLSRYLPLFQLTATAVGWLFPLTMLNV